MNNFKPIITRKGFENFCKNFNIEDKKEWEKRFIIQEETKYKPLDDPKIAQAVEEILNKKGPKKS